MQDNFEVRQDQSDPDKPPEMGLTLPDWRRDNSPSLSTALLQVYLNISQLRLREVNLS